MENENKTYDLKVEKLIPLAVGDVFRAISEGRLFSNCSADHESMKIDFKIGGKYSIEFLNYNMKNKGEFLEIIPNRKIVFTWCQDYDTNPTPDTTVSVHLKDVDGQTALTLTHTGFNDLENKNGHEGGWSGGLDDLTQEMANGKLHFTRIYKMPLEKLYETFKNPDIFFGLMADVKKGQVDFRVGGKYDAPSKNGKISGEFLEIVPNHKIVFSWKSAPCGEPLTNETKVSLLFEKEDEKSAWITLDHEGLKKESQQKAHREGWDAMLKRVGF